MFTKLLTYCICKPGQLSFGESCGMHFLLKDGKGLAIINTLFCRDGSKALPEKKKFITSFLRQHGCVYVRNGRFLEFRRATRGRIWPRFTLGGENSRGKRKHWFEIQRPGLWFQPLCSPAFWELSLSIWKMGGWTLQIFPSFFFKFISLCWMVVAAGRLGVQGL